MGVYICDFHHADFLFDVAKVPLVFMC